MKYLKQLTVSPWMSLLRCFLLLALTLGLSSCGSKTPSSNVLAKVGEREITVEDFAREIDRLRASRRPIPDKKHLLSQMVEFEALVQRARKLGIDRDPATKREIENLMIGKLQEKELTCKLTAVEVSTDEVKAEYEKSISRYTRPAKVRLAVLFQELPTTSTESRRVAARERLHQATGKILAQGQPDKGSAPGFGVLALEYSDDQASRYRGGDLGWLDEGQVDYRLPGEVLQAGYRLPVGEISPIVETEKGFFVVMKTDYREKSVAPFSQVERVIRHGLLSDKKERLRESYLNDAVNRLTPEINEKLLDSVEVSPSMLAAAERAGTAPPSLPATSLPSTRVQ